MSAPKASVLTERQREIVRLTALGMSRKEIAAHFSISHKTVDYHFLGRPHRQGCRTILQRLGFCDVATLTRYAIRENLVTCDV